MWQNCEKGLICLLTLWGLISLLAKKDASYETDKILNVTKLALI